MCEKDEERPVQKERFVSTANDISQSLEFGSGEQTKPFIRILFIQTSFSTNEHPDVSQDLLVLPSSV